jgi:hypothetical protein
MAHDGSAPMTGIATGIATGIVTGIVTGEALPFNRISLSILRRLTCKSVVTS